MLELDDAVVITRDANGKVKLHQSLRTSLDNEAEERLQMVLGSSARLAAPGHQAAGGAGVAATDTLRQMQGLPGSRARIVIGGPA